MNVVDHGLNPDWQSQIERWAAVSDAVHNALTLGDWVGVETILAARLTEQERTALAAAALWPMHPENVRSLSETVIGSYGPPDRVRQAFQGLVKEARSWAQAASVSECRAYAFSAIEAMDEPEQRQLLNWLEGKLKNA